MCYSDYYFCYYVAFFFSIVDITYSIVSLATRVVLTLFRAQPFFLVGLEVAGIYFCFQQLLEENIPYLSL